MPQPLILTDPDLRIPGDRPYWTTPEMVDMTRGYGYPTWRSNEVGKMFGMSQGWMRKHLAYAYPIDGEPFVPLRTPGMHVYFRLWDIERWAHALAQHQVINGKRLEIVIALVKLFAQAHGYLR